MKDIHELRYEASHDLWEAKATSRLESMGRLHHELSMLAHDGKISSDVMMEIYGILGANNDREEAAVAEAEAYYEELYRAGV